MTDTNVRISAELASQTLRFALTAQMAVIGELMVVLAKNRTLAAEQIFEVLNNTADLIEEPLHRSPTDLQALLILPLREHVKALRALAERTSAPKN